AFVLDLGLSEPSEIAELGAAERLHPDPRRQGHLGDISVLRAGIDRVVEALVDLVEALGIAGIAEEAQLFMYGFELMTFDRRHPLRGEPSAQGFELGHRLEHPGQPLDRWSRDHRATMSAGLDQA